MCLNGCVYQWDGWWVDRSVDTSVSLAVCINRIRRQMCLNGDVYQWDGWTSLSLTGCVYNPV